MTEYVTKMTPEQIAEARRLVDAATPGPYFKNHDDNELTKSVRTLVPKLLDALETAERERDNWKEAGAHYLRSMEYYRDLCDSVAPLFGASIYIADDGTRSTEPLRAKIPELVVEQIKERDAARAQVETLAEALREIAEDAIDIDGRNGERALAALKAAGLTADGSQEASNGALPTT